MKAEQLLLPGSAEWRRREAIHDVAVAISGVLAATEAVRAAAGRAYLAGVTLRELGAVIAPDRSGSTHYRVGRALVDGSL